MEQRLPFSTQACAPLASEPLWHLSCKRGMANTPRCLRHHQRRPLHSQGKAYSHLSTRPLIRSLQTKRHVPMCILRYQGRFLNNQRETHLLDSCGTSLLNQMTCQTPPDAFFAAQGAFFRSKGKRTHISPPDLRHLPRKPKGRPNAPVCLPHNQRCHQTQQERRERRGAKGNTKSPLPPDQTVSSSLFLFRHQTKNCPQPHRHQQQKHQHHPQQQQQQHHHHHHRTTTTSPTARCPSRPAAATTTNSVPRPLARVLAPARPNLPVRPLAPRPAHHHHQHHISRRAPTTTTTTMVGTVRPLRALLGDMMYVFHALITCYLQRLIKNSQHDIVPGPRRPPSWGQGCRPAQ